MSAPGVEAGPSVVFRKVAARRVHHPTACNYVCSRISAGNRPSYRAFLPEPTEGKQDGQEMAWE